MKDKFFMWVWMWGCLGLVNSYRQSDMDSLPECAERGWPEIGWGSGSTGHLRASGCVIYFLASSE